MQEDPGFAGKSDKGSKSWNETLLGMPPVGSQKKEPQSLEGGFDTQIGPSLSLSLSLSRSLACLAAVLGAPGDASGADVPQDLQGLP